MYLKPWTSYPMTFGLKPGSMVYLCGCSAEVHVRNQIRDLQRGTWVVGSGKTTTPCFCLFSIVNLRFKGLEQYHVFVKQCFAKSGAKLPESPGLKGLSGHYWQKWLFYWFSFLKKPLRNKGPFSVFYVKQWYFLKETVFFLKVDETPL